MKVVVLIVALLCGLALANSYKGWLPRESVSSLTKICGGDTNQKSYLSRQGVTGDERCAQRCYATEFVAAAETNGSPSGLCNNIGEECTISVFLKTSPCCTCPEGKQVTRVSIDEDSEEFDLVATESYCDIEQLLVLVNGLWTLPCDADCNITAPPGLEQVSLRHDSTVTDVTDCSDSSSGSDLHLVFNHYYNQPVFPDPAFLGNHWRSSFDSEQSGLISSEFTLYRPNSASVWFNQQLTVILTPIDCATIPTEYETVPECLL